MFGEKAAKRFVCQRLPLPPEHSATPPVEGRSTNSSGWGRGNKRADERERLEKRAVLDLCLQLHREKMAANGTSEGSTVSKYETAEGLKEVAAFLRGRNGMPLRPAIEVDKRVEYFKGETGGRLPQQYESHHKAPLSE